MKFAKELEDELVPEWRVKYFSYKIGKKKIKAVSRALRNVNRTPQTNARPEIERALSDEQLPFTFYDFNSRHSRAAEPQAHHVALAQSRVAGEQSEHSKDGHPGAPDRRTSLTMFASSPPDVEGENQGDQPPVPEEEEEEDDIDDDDESDESSNSEPAHNSRTPLQRKQANGAYAKQYSKYGSISGSPQETAPIESLSALHLPDPAIDPNKVKSSTTRSDIGDDRSQSSSKTPKLSRNHSDQAGGQKNQTDRRGTASLPNLSKSLFGKGSKKSSAKAKIRRAFTQLALDSPGMTSNQFDSYKELDARQDEFFSFLDRELKKIEDFYKSKEDEATSRLEVLREQLHEMRDRRLKDLKLAKKGVKIADDGLLDGQIPIFSQPFTDQANGHSVTKNLMEPVFELFSANGKIGKTSKAREELGSPRAPLARKKSNDRGDYVRKKQPHEKVPYRNAKRKLKLAMQEFYRGLELLKSYTLLNRTAFRKINKKYDKAVFARPPLRYMSERVNHAHFVQSTKVDDILVHVEDLYARYFERGNRKIAVSKLRSHLRQGDRSGNAFRNGLFVAAGIGLAISGFVKGAPFLFSEDITLKTQSSYLFQMYGGYLMAVLLMLFFIIDCRIWTKNRVNYVFVFEYDTRHVLDWRQLAELPCFFLFLDGLFFWLNFEFSDWQTMFLYWPIILIGITAVIICCPFKILYYRARKWFLFSNWRLLLAGLYPVEFRDFFMGDMYCSETYTISQLEVFFCVYVRNWDDPQQCNSSHSRLLGFLTCLPAIWRSFQCLRRYYDSRNWFPHLANFVKYLCNILYYMSLSLYRMQLNSQMRALMIVFAAINGVYCAFWDVFMDFSLGNPWSKNFLLRDNLAFRRKRYYYGVIILDVVFRQQWIFYALFTSDLQHSAAMSFFVSVMEVIRRGVWSLFRVENEHCNNVANFRASRDIPLPYSKPESRVNSVDFSKQPEMRQKPGPPQSPGGTILKQDAQPPGGQAAASSVDLERATTGSSSGMRKRRNTVSSTTTGISALQRVSNVIAQAHAQDFTKKRNTTELVRSPTDTHMQQDWSDDEDVDAMDDEDLERESAAAANAPDGPDTADQPTAQRGSLEVDERDFGNQSGRQSTSSSAQQAQPQQQGDHHDDGNGHTRNSSGFSGNDTGSGSGTVRRHRARAEQSEQSERESRSAQRTNEIDDIETAEAEDLVDRARGPI